MPQHLSMEYVCVWQYIARSCRVLFNLVAWGYEDYSAKTAKAKHEASIAGNGY